MPNSSNVLLARQPIFDSSLETVGYELLCRPIPMADEEWQIVSGDSATNEVLLSAFDELGIEEVTAGLPAYINFTEHWLNNPPPFAAEHVVIEILEHIQATEKNINAVRQLKHAGYTIALDDYHGDPLQDGFLPFTDIIKVDLKTTSDPSRVSGIIAAKGRENFCWLAEKVETQGMYEACLDLGFSHFQGYFFSRPADVYGNKQASNKTVVFDLLSCLQDPDISVEVLESKIAADPSLSFRLLKLVNSASFAQHSKVDSIQRAITIAGMQQVKSWVTMLSLGSLEDKPKELRVQSLQRAHFCAHLSDCVSKIERDVAFTAGLLSNIDAFFDAPLKDLLDKIHLHPDIKSALSERKGRLGFVYTTVKAMELGQWDKIRWDLWQKAGLDPSQVEWFYLESIREAERIISAMD